MARNYAERVAKGGFVVLVMSLVAAVIGYALRVFLSRNLTIEEFGLFYAVLAFISAFTILKTFELPTALTKYISSFLVKKDLVKIKAWIIHVAVVQYASGVIVFLFLFLFSNYIVANFFKNPLAGPVFTILLIEFLINASYFHGIFQGFQKMRFFSMIDFLRIIILSAFVLFLINLGPVGVAWSYLGSTISVHIILFYFVLRVFPTFFKERFKLGSIINWKLQGRLWKFSLKLFIGSFAGIFISYASTILLTALTTFKEVGYFQVALPTSQLLWVFPISLGAILFPVASEIWTRGEKKLLSEGIERLIKFSFILLLPLAMILFSFPEIIIRMLFGEAYLPAAPVLQVLSIGAIFYALLSICSQIIIGIGKPAKYTMILWIMAIFNVSLNILLIPILGVFGAGLTTTLSYLIGFLSAVYFLGGNVRFRIPWLDLFKTFFGGVIMLLIIFSLKGMILLNSSVEAVMIMAVAFVFYAIFLVFTRLVKKDDVRRLGAELYLPKRLLRLIFKILRE